MWGHITNQKQTIFEEMGKNSDSVFFAKASGGSFVITLITLIMFVVMLFICRIHYFTITFWFMVAAGLIDSSVYCAAGTKKSWRFRKEKKFPK